MATKKLTFEEAMARLEAIVARLEKGTALMKQCSTALDQAEQKVAKLFPAADASPVEEPMEGMEL